MWNEHRNVQLQLLHLIDSHNPIFIWGITWRIINWHWHSHGQRQPIVESLLLDKGAWVITAVSWWRNSHMTNIHWWSGSRTAHAYIVVLLPLHRVASCGWWSNAAYSAFWIRKLLLLLEMWHYSFRTMHYWLITALFHKVGLGIGISWGWRPSDICMLIPFHETLQLCITGVFWFLAFMPWYMQQGRKQFLQNSFAIFHM